jgi:hypothetical protein
MKHENLIVDPKGMKARPRLYLETTIPSYLVARPRNDLRLSADQAATLDWWENGRGRFDIFISAVVLREIGRGEPEMAAKRQAIVEGLPILDLTNEAEMLAARAASSF